MVSSGEAIMAASQCLICASVLTFTTVRNRVLEKRLLAVSLSRLVNGMSTVVNRIYTDVQVSGRPVSAQARAAPSEN